MKLKETEQPAFSNELLKTVGYIGKRGMLDTQDTNTVSILLNENNNCHVTRMNRPRRNSKRSILLTKEKRVQVTPVFTKSNVNVTSVHSGASVVQARHQNNTVEKIVEIICDDGHILTSKPPKEMRASHALLVQDSGEYEDYLSSPSLVKPTVVESQPLQDNTVPTRSIPNILRSNGPKISSALESTNCYDTLDRKNTVVELSNANVLVDTVTSEGEYDTSTKKVVRKRKQVYNLTDIRQEAPDWAEDNLSECVTNEERKKGASKGARKTKHFKDTQRKMPNDCCTKNTSVRSRRIIEHNELKRDNSQAFTLFADSTELPFMEEVRQTDIEEFSGNDIFNKVNYKFNNIDSMDPFKESVTDPDEIYELARYTTDDCIGNQIYDINGNNVLLYDSEERTQSQLTYNSINNYIQYTEVPVTLDNIATSEIGNCLSNKYIEKCKLDCTLLCNQSCKLDHVSYCNDSNSSWDTLFRTEKQENSHQTESSDINVCSVDMLSEVSFVTESNSEKACNNHFPNGSDYGESEDKALEISELKNESDYTYDLGAYENLLSFQMTDDNINFYITNYDQNNLNSLNQQIDSITMLEEDTPLFQDSEVVSLNSVESPMTDWVIHSEGTVNKLNVDNTRHKLDLSKEQSCDTIELRTEELTHVTENLAAPEIKRSCNDTQSTTLRNVEEVQRVITDNLIDSKCLKDSSEQMKFTTVKSNDNNRLKSKKSQKNVTIRCFLCSLTFTSQRAASLHRAGAHKGMYMILCESCGRFFNNKYHFNRHIIYCAHIRMNFKCHNCSKVYRHKSSLVHHLKTVHQVTYNNESKMYTCDVCRKIYAKHGAFEKHMALHNIAEPWQ